MSKSYNIYVRFKDASENNGWGQIIYDSTASLNGALDALNSIGRNAISLLGEDRGFVVTRNDSGLTYDDSEHIEAIAKIIDSKSAMLGIITNDSYIPYNVISSKKFGEIDAGTYTKSSYFRYYIDEVSGKKIHDDPIGLWKRRLSEEIKINNVKDMINSYGKHISYIEVVLQANLSVGHRNLMSKEMTDYLRSRYEEVVEGTSKYGGTILSIRKTKEDLFYTACDPMSFFEVYDKYRLINAKDLQKIIRNTLTPLDVLAKPLLKLV